MYIIINKTLGGKIKMKKKSLILALTLSLIINSGITLLNNTKPSTKQSFKPPIIRVNDPGPGDGWIKL